MTGLYFSGTGNSRYAAFIRYSFMVESNMPNYCANVLDGDYQNLEAIVTALYRYYKAAKDYAG